MCGLIDIYVQNTALLPISRCQSL